MRSNKRLELIHFDPKIKNTCRRNRKERHQALIQQHTMDETLKENLNKSLRDYAVPQVDVIQTSIVRPAIRANNFELKPAIIQMVQTSVQFGGFLLDDPNDHIVNFLEICDTFKFNGVSIDAIRLRLFPFSLQDKAKNWLNSLPSGSITAWDDLAQKFLSK